MAERDSKGRFLPGNLTSKTNLGVRHSDNQEMRDMLDKCLSYYDGDALYELLEQITDPERKLVYLIKMLETNTKHIEARNRFDLEKLKVELQFGIGDTTSDVIEVTYIEENEEE